MLRINPVNLKNSSSIMFKSLNQQENVNFELDNIIGADYIDEFIPSISNQRNDLSNVNSLKGFLEKLFKTIQKIK